ATDLPSHIRTPRGRFGDASEDLKQRALAASILADDAKHFAAANLQIEVTKSPKCALGSGRILLVAEQTMPQPLHWYLETENVVPGVSLLRKSAEPVHLSKLVRADCKLAQRRKSSCNALSSGLQMMSAKTRSMRRNAHTPDNANKHVAPKAMKSL